MMSRWARTSLGCVRFKPQLRYKSVHKGSVNEILFAVLADKDKQLADKDKQLDDKDKQLANKDKQLADKDKQLDDKDKQLADKDKQLADKESQFDMVKKTITEQETLVKTLKQKLLPPELKNPSLYYSTKEYEHKFTSESEIQAKNALNSVSVPAVSLEHALRNENEIESLLGVFYDPNRSASLPIWDKELLLQRLAYMPEFRFEDNTRVKIEQISGPLSIVSSSGSGKTATILQHLSKTYGFYFACNQHDEKFNQSKSLNETFDRGMSKLYSTCLDARDQDEFDMRLRRVILVFFFLQCKFLCAAISKSSVPVTPLTFLEWQLNGNNAIFGQFLFETLRQKYHMNIRYEDLLLMTQTELARLLQKLNAKSFVVAIDEAQAFVKCSDFYVYSINGKPREGCLLSMLLWQTYEIFSPHRDSTLVITSGTGYSNDHHTISISTLQKGLFDLRENALSAPLLYSANQVIHYLKLHINLPNECVQWIKSAEFYNLYLPIRIRFVARVIAHMIKTPIAKRPLEHFKACWQASTSELIEQLSRTMNSLQLSTEAQINLYKLAWRHFTQEVQHLIPTESFAQLVVTSHCVHYQLQSVEILPNFFKLVLSVDPTEPYFRGFLQKSFAFNWLENTMQWLIYERISPSSRNYFEVLVFLALSKFHNHSFSDIKWIPVELGLSSLKFYCEKIVNPVTLRIYLENLDFQIPTNAELKEWGSTFFSSEHELTGDNEEKLKVIRKNLQLMEEDLLYWFIASNKDSAKLLNGIAYRPSSNAHPDILILLPEANLIVSLACRLSDSKTNDHIRKRFVNNIAQASPHFFYQTGLPESISELKEKITTPIPPPWGSWKWLCVPVFCNVFATSIPDSVGSLSFETLSSAQQKYVPVTHPSKEAIPFFPPLVDSWLKMQFHSHRLNLK